MNVLHVVPSFRPAYVYGGPIRSTFELCRGLVRLGCDVRVLTTDTNGPSALLNVDTCSEIRDPEGFHIRYCHRILSHSFSPQMLRHMRSYLQWADIVHLTGVYNFPTLPTLLLCRKLRKPVIWSPRGAMQRWHGSRRVGLKSAWDFLASRIGDRSRLILHFTSQQEADETLARISNFRSAVIPNGVSIPSSITRSDFKDVLRLLYIGRLDPKKGIESLLKACTIVSTTFQPKYHLAIAGSGTPAYLAQLKQLVNDLGLAQNVTMKGEVLAEAKQQAFENSDVVIVPSHTENFAMVVAEALAHSLPVIASTGTPWKELVDRRCGLWVNNDPHSLAAAIREISSMPLREMGHRGRLWMEAEFSWPSIAAKMLALYQQSTGAAHPGEARTCSVSVAS